MTITLRTVGDFLDYEHELMVACMGANCGEHKGVDLAELAGRLGRDRQASVAAGLAWAGAALLLTARRADDESSVLTQY